MCQLITAATYLLKRNNSAEDAYPAHLTSVKRIQSCIVSGADTSSLMQALWKNVCSLEVQLLCSTAACAQEEVSPKEKLCVRCWKPTYEPADPKSPNLRPVRSSCSRRNEQANTNMQIHRNSLPKLQAEITRAIVPIPSISPIERKFSLLQDSTESWKCRRSGKGHLYKKVKERQSLQLVPVLEKRCEVWRGGN